MTAPEPMTPAARSPTRHGGRTGDPGDGDRARPWSRRAGLGITFTAVLPRFSPLTGVGRPAVRAYAADSGMSVEEFLKTQGPLVSPEIAGTALVELVQADADDVARAYLLNGDGLQKLP